MGKQGALPPQSFSVILLALLALCVEVPLPDLEAIRRQFQGSWCLQEQYC